MSLKLRYRLSKWLNGQDIITRDNLAKAIKEVESQRRSQILTENTADNKIVEPFWNYESLVAWAKGNEVLRTVHEAIIKEVTRNRWIVKPKWIRRCPMCGNEFQGEVEKCPDCKHSNGVSVATVKPDIKQKHVLKAFLDDPNPDDEMIDIVVSTLRYMLSVDDWYLSLQDAQGDPFTGSPFTIYVEDSVYMRVCADKFGRIGNREIFCIEDREHPDRVIPPGQQCPEHPGSELKETAYIYKDGSIKARFAKDEILHGVPDAWKPSLYGFSKEISCLRIVMSIAAMNQFNFDNYSEGKLGNVLVFQGMPQAQADDLAQAVERQKNMPKYDVNTGKWIIKKLRTLFLGSPEGVTNVPAMPESEKMQSLDWWKLWREIVCAVYGVTPVFTGVVESGKTGNNPRMQIDVQNNTTEYYQKAFAEPFNNVVVPRLGVTDWVFEFNPVEEKDEMQDVTVLQAKLTAMQTAISMGMKAELTDEKEVKITGSPLSLEQKQQMQMEMFSQRQAVNPSNGEPSKGDKEVDKSFEGKKPFKKEEVFATEKGKSWIVTEVKKND